MAEPIAALIVRILADTAEMVTGVKNVSGQLDSLESKVGKFGKAIAGVFTVQALIGFSKQILSEVAAIDTAAKRLGASSEEFQRFSYAVKQSGGDAEAATAGIVSLTDKLASGDSGLLNVLRKLNINIDEFKAKDPITRYMELGLAIAGVSDPAKQLELRLEALGTKGEAALASINSEMSDLAKDAPVYSEETIQALKQAEDIFEHLWMTIKVGASEAVVALASVGKAADELAKKRQRQGAVNKSEGFLGQADAYADLPDPMNPGAPAGPPKNIPTLGPGGVDPNDAKAMAVVLADLAIEYTKVKHAAEAIDEEWKRQIDILKMLKIEATPVSDAIGQLMDRMGTSTKVDQFTNRIITAAQRIAALTAETERLMEIINPGSTKLAGDDVDREIFKLRSDPRNFKQDGNLTDQALEIESLLLNNFSLQLLANQVKPVGNPQLGTVMGSNRPGFASVMNPTSVTINAQGGFWNNPDQLNQLGRLIEDVLAGRQRGSDPYSRR